MKLSHLVVLAFFVALFVDNSAQARDWVQLQGLEPDENPQLKTLVVLQPQFSHTEGRKLPAGPFNGQEAVFNLNGPRFEKASSLQLTRGFLIGRGNIPGWETRLNYFALLDVGENLTTGSAKTTTEPVSVQLSDLSLTLRHTPIGHLRFGQFLTPGSNEMLRPVQFHDYLNFTNFTLFTQLDWGLPQAGDGSTDNRPTRPNSGFRDIGLQVFNQIQGESLRHSYAVMVANGNGITRWENDGHQDLILRYRLASEQDPAATTELVLWGISGQRKLRLAGTAEESYRRDRFGFDLGLKRGAHRAELSYGEAYGMIFHGTQGAGQPGLVNAGNVVASWLVLPTEIARGYVGSYAYEFSETQTYGWRWDRVNYGMKNANNERVFETLAVSAQYHFSKKINRVVFNYELRSAKAPGLPEQNAVNQFLKAIDNRTSLSLFWFF